MSRIHQEHLQAGYIFGDPVNEEYKLYPDEYRYKYPKAGEKNSTVSVKIYEIRYQRELEDL